MGTLTVSNLNLTTLKATEVKHPDAATPAIVLNADGTATIPSAGKEPIPIGLSDWPVTLTKDEGVLTEAVYVRGTEQYKQFLNYTEGVLTSVDYSKSEDDGVTWTNIGTETLNYTDGELTHTSWVAA